MPFQSAVINLTLLSRSKLCLCGSWIGRDCRVNFKPKIASCLSDYESSYLDLPYLSRCIFWSIMLNFSLMVKTLITVCQVKISRPLSVFRSCSYDYLALYDGPYLNSTYLGRFCGRSFLPISSTGNYLTLQFITNNYNQYGGFKLHYNFTQTIIRM